MRPVVWVLLPVYNGAQFLEEQLESILNQSYSPLRILCRDDGSTDNSVEVLDAYAARHPDKIQCLSDQSARLGAIGSFAWLMQAGLEEANRTKGTGSYFALSDQDDIWLPDKLEQTVAALQSAEKATPGVPILAHSDLSVMAANGGELAPSLMRYQGLDPTRTGFAAQLVSNTVTGCTAVFNLALMRRALPIPESVMMHDWWLSLVASAFGQIVYLPKPLVRYRQHAGNTLGARRHEPIGINYGWLKRLFRLRKDPMVDQQFKRLGRQAEVFAERFGHELDPTDRNTLEWVEKMPSLGLWRQRVIFRGCARK